MIKGPLENRMSYKTCLCISIMSQTVVSIIKIEILKGQADEEM